MSTRKPSEICNDSISHRGWGWDDLGWATRNCWMTSHLIIKIKIFSSIYCTTACVSGHELVPSRWQQLNKSIFLSYTEIKESHWWMTWSRGLIHFLYLICGLATCIRVLPHPLYWACAHEHTYIHTYGYNIAEFVVYYIYECNLQTGNVLSGIKWHCHTRTGYSQPAEH